MDGNSATVGAASSASCSADVVVIGSCMIDLISYVEHLPKPGETIHGHTFSQGFGGKGANQCVMAARLGARCAMVAKLGDDSFGRSTIKNFKDNGINTEHVSVTSAAASGVASITVNSKGENAIVIVSGANQALRPEEVVQGTRDLVAGAKVVICQLEISPETTLAALKLAKGLGVVTILNTAPGVKGLDRQFFENADILCLNETEAELVTGLPVTDLETATQAVRTLQASGTRCIVLTLGEKGLLYTQLVTRRVGSGEWSPIGHITAEKVQVVDTTGAGDAFVGALAGYIATSPPSSLLPSSRDEEQEAAGSLLLGELLRKAATVASHSVTRRGTQTSYEVDTLRKDLLIRNSE